MTFQTPPMFAFTEQQEALTERLQAIRDLPVDQLRHSEMIEISRELRSLSELNRKYARAVCQYAKERSV